MSRRLPEEAAESAANCLELQAMEARPLWPAVARASVPMAVRVALPGVRLRDVSALMVGATFLSRWPMDAEVPLLAGGVTFGWCEFEGAGRTMAVRLTRLG